MSKLERVINYKFSNIHLLKKALTHSSIDNINSYERLEFLGDSIINNIISDYLFRKFPSDSESDLSKKRMQLVNKKYISKISKSLNLYKYLRIEKNIAISNRIHCDIYESIIGAIYSDSKNTQIIKKIVKKTLIDKFIKFEDIVDYKGEIINCYNKKIISDLNIDTKNLLNSKKFISSINITSMYFYGFGSNKLDAEQRASFLAMNYINNYYYFPLINQAESSHL